MRERKSAMKKAYNPNSRRTRSGILEKLGEGLLVGTFVVDASLVEDPKSYVLSVRNQFIAKGYRVEVMPVNDKELYNFTFRRNG